MSASVRGFARIDRLATFARDYKKLDPQQQLAVDACIRDLTLPIIPAARRWHKVDRTARPPIFTVDVFPNKSYKLSCQIDPADAQTLVLRRVATHREIDRQA